MSKQPTETEPKKDTSSTESVSQPQNEQPESRLHAVIGRLINGGLHIAPIVAVAITWSLSARAFGHTGNHLGLAAIELSFLLVASALTMGFIRGRAHSAAAWASVTLLVGIIGLNCATGFYTSETGYLLEDAPEYLNVWRTHALAWTPIIAIFLTVIFAALDGDIQDSIGAKRFELWKSADERRTEQLRDRATAAQKAISARVQLTTAQRLTRSVRSRARSDEFKTQTNNRADAVLKNQIEADAINDLFTGKAGNG